MNYSIGVDLGGTNIKISTVSPDGEILDKQTCETADATGHSWAETIKRKIDEIQTQRGVHATRIGLASPGLPAKDGLSIVNMPGRLAGLEGLIWTDFLKASHPVLVLNDAQAALLGELWKGAAKGYQNVVLLTLGTGVGGAILADGRLIRGHLGRAGHLGHITLNLDGEPDIVGTRGSLEEMIGNYNLSTRSNGRFTSTADLVDAYVGGDSQATEIWMRSMQALAAGITSIINAIDPEVVVLGGGVARAGSALFEPLSQFMDKMEWRPLGTKVPIIPAALGNWSGTLGAVYHALHSEAPVFE